jgi:hypothetical protein
VAEVASAHDNIPMHFSSSSTCGNAGDGFYELDQVSHVRASIPSIALQLFSPIPSMGQDFYPEVVV